MNINNKLKVTGKLVFRMLVVSILLISVGCSVDENQTVINFKNLVKADEFSVDGAPDNSMWGYDIGTGDDTPSGSGWGNNELQYYTDRLDNVKVEDGMLHIIARKEGYMGAHVCSF